MGHLIAVGGWPSQAFQETLTSRPVATGLKGIYLKVIPCEKCYNTDHSSYQIVSIK